MLSCQNSRYKIIIFSLTVVFLVLAGAAVIPVRADANLPTLTNTLMPTKAATITPIPPPTTAPQMQIMGEPDQPKSVNTPVPLPSTSSEPVWQQPFAAGSNATLNWILLIVIFLAWATLMGLIVYAMYRRFKEHQNVE